MVSLRPIESTDCPLISQAFRLQGWDKPVSLYESYVTYQSQGTRDIIIAEWGGAFAGYLTVNWTSDYPLFRERQIPEIVDFNVLQKYQRRRIGTALMDEAERRIKRVSARAGIGFGLYQDYGAAQILYIKRSYIPDGNGLAKDAASLPYGETIVLDDSLALYLTKLL